MASKVTITEYDTGFRAAQSYVVSTLDPIVATTAISNDPAKVSKVMITALRYKLN